MSGWIAKTDGSALLRDRRRIPAGHSWRTRMGPIYSLFLPGRRLDHPALFGGSASPVDQPVAGPCLLDGNLELVSEEGVGYECDPYRLPYIPGTGGTGRVELPDLVDAAAPPSAARINGGSTSSEITGPQIDRIWCGGRRAAGHVV